MFTWSGGLPPYTFTITTASGRALVQDPSSDSGTENKTYFWNPVDISAGTLLFAGVQDSNQKVAFSGVFEIQPGDGGCLETVRPSCYQVQVVSDTENVCDIGQLDVASVALLVF